MFDRQRSFLILFKELRFVEKIGPDNDLESRVLEAEEEEEEEEEKA